MAIKIQMEVQISNQLKALLKRVKNPIDRETAKDAGEATISAMKDLIASGTSPIEGNGKFPQYKNRKKYPGQRKAATPVNLELTGKFLDSLKHDVVTDASGYAAQVFYQGKEGIKERGHREGSNGQPKRPTLPTEKGERFTAKVRLAYETIFKNRILELLKR